MRTERMLKFSEDKAATTSLLTRTTKPGWSLIGPYCSVRSLNDCSLRLRRHPPWLKADLSRIIAVSTPGTHGQHQWGLSTCRNRCSTRPKSVVYALTAAPTSHTSRLSGQRQPAMTWYGLRATNAGRPGQPTGTRRRSTRAAATQVD